jgi:hypothetical protein
MHVCVCVFLERDRESFYIKEKKVYPVGSVRVFKYITKHFWDANWTTPLVYVPDFECVSMPSLAYHTNVNAVFQTDTSFKLLLECKGTLIKSFLIYGIDIAFVEECRRLNTLVHLSEFHKVKTII